MVLGRIQDAILGKPTLEGPSRVPNYFPVQPRGCEKHAGNLFECIAKEATEKAKVKRFLKFISKKLTRKARLRFF